MVRIAVVSNMSHMNACLERLASRKADRRTDSQTDSKTDIDSYITDT